MNTSLTTLQSGMGWFPQQAGGLNRMYYNLLHHLPDAGVRVHGMVTGQRPPRNGFALEAFAATEAPLLHRWRGARATARRVIRTAQPDLVASHFALYTLPWIDQMGDRPFVMHFHGPWALEGAVESASVSATWAKRQIEQTVYRRADHFIVLSKAFRDLLCQTYGIAPERVSIVPGGVDVDAFATDASPADLRAHLGWPTDRPIVLAVRRLARRMGLENLVESIATVRRYVPNVLLCIAGKGPLHKTLQAQIDARGLHDHVRLLGFVSDADLRRAYRAADLSVVPTVALEGFGLITIESLAAGTPVLVTPIGGLPEVVAPLSDRLVLPDASTNALIDGLVSTLRSPETLPDADACIAYARRHFDWPQIARHTRRTYESVLAVHA